MDLEAIDAKIEEKRQAILDATSVVDRARLRVERDHLLEDRIALTRAQR